MNKFLIIFCLLLHTLIHAQQHQQLFAVTDSVPVALNGLQAGYTIKEVDLESKKDGQSRYKIYFWLTNTSPEAKIMYKNPGFHGHFGPISNIIALFNCRNATGARFTNKMASMELQPCQIEAEVTDKDCSNGKEVKSTRTVNLGYWLRPNETVSKTYLVYVPSGQKPDVAVTFYSEPANATATFVTSTYTNSSSQQQTAEAFVRLKNVGNGMYLHNQNGPLACTTIDLGWWSAQWEIVPVPNSNYYNIRNRWKNSFISTDSNTLLSNDGRATGSQWVMESVAGTNTYTFKNLATGYKLVFQNNALGTANVFGAPAYAQWVIEQ